MEIESSDFEEVTAVRVRRAGVEKLEFFPLKSEKRFLARRSGIIEVLYFYALSPVPPQRVSGRWSST